MFDVAVPGGVQRPGMAVVSRLPSGGYVMTFELCPADRCPVHLKRSADGLHWGDAADVGVPVRTRAGVALAGTPYNVWTPAGGPAGSVVVSAHDERGVAGRRVLLVSSDTAFREWRAVPAPVQWQGGNDHAGWSNALLPAADGRGVLHLVSSAVGDGRRNEIRYAAAPLNAPLGSPSDRTSGDSSGGPRRAAFGPDSFANPVVRTVAAGDPWVVRDGGWYYFTATMGPGRGVWIWRSRTLTGLDSATKVRVWTAPDTGPTSRQVWAPELHKLRGRWYLYVTASDGVDDHHRLYVLAARTGDPLGAYDPPARVDPAERYAIDGTVLTMPDGRLYFLYCANGVYVAPMADPTRVSGPAVQIVRGTEPWEHGWRLVGGRWEQDAGYWVEAPEPLVHNGRVFLTYSAGHTATPHYYLGLLSLAPGRDPLDPAAWTKRREPVLAPYVGPDGAVYTPGHNGFTTSPDGTEDWLVYHAKDGAADATGGNDYSPRTVRVQRFTWAADGTPAFGRPVPSGVPLRKPAGE